MTEKTNASGVPFLSGKRISTDNYKKNFDKIDWSTKSEPKDKEDNS